MRIATFVYNGTRQVGQVSEDGQQVTPFALSTEQARRGALPLIEAAVEGRPLPAFAGAPLALASVQLQAPLPLPRRNLWCVGRNYHAHAKELSASVFKDSNADTKAWPIVFTKVPECVVGPFDDVQLPGAAVSEQIDYEAELAVVIGQGGKNITQAQAMQHVFGYTVVNDVTARDVQMR
ncbi:MAG: fumarylacetoacetate hydrolase family protein, partial [Limnohabitans sp.]